MPKFSVTVQRIRTEFLIVEVEADSYQEARTAGRRQAEATPSGWTLNPHIEDKFQVSSTDIQGNPWSKDPA